MTTTAYRILDTRPRRKDIKTAQTIIESLGINARLDYSTTCTASLEVCSTYEDYKTIVKAYRLHTGKQKF